MGFGHCGRGTLGLLFGIWVVVGCDVSHLPFLRCCCQLRCCCVVVFNQRESSAAAIGVVVVFVVV